MPYLDSFLSNSGGGAIPFRHLTERKLHKANKQLKPQRGIDLRVPFRLYLLHNLYYVK